MMMVVMVTVVMKPLMRLISVVMMRRMIAPTAKQNQCKKRGQPAREYGLKVVARWKAMCRPSHLQRLQEYPSSEMQRTRRTIWLKKKRSPATFGGTAHCVVISRTQTPPDGEKDTKPAKILLSVRGCAKLSDFGLAVRCGSLRAVTIVGPPSYMAPEVLAEGL